MESRACDERCPFEIGGVGLEWSLPAGAGLLRQMHGVKREHDASKVEAKRVADASKIAEFCAQLAAAQQARERAITEGSADSARASLEASEKALLLNPSHYTCWNARKEALLTLGVAELLENERKLTLKCLQLNPKSYCIWEHRRWCLEQAATDQDMRQKELALCEKLHAMDSRNFHCWNYRRWLIGVEEAVQPDLTYTRRMINEDFSNYSAWHARSVAFSSAPLDSQSLAAEWELIFNAMYTGPQDQSVWMYVYWLLDKCSNGPDTILRLADSCCELIGVDGEAQSKWALLTLVKLLTRGEQVKLPPTHNSRDALVAALIRVDPLRKNYYKSRLG